MITFPSKSWPAIALLALASSVTAYAESADQIHIIETKDLPEATLRNSDEFRRKLVGNYPAINIPRDVQATATILVRVNIQGRATSCQITKSSGVSIIDQWACRGTVRYARFIPASDADSNPVESQWSESLTLTLGNPDAPGAGPAF